MQSIYYSQCEADTTVAEAPPLKAYEQCGGITYTGARPSVHTRHFSLRLSQVHMQSSCFWHTGTLSLACLLATDP
jgi:hypothetical protein